MYPPLTSLMPVYVALARWLEQGGSIVHDFPYWYNGTTPFRSLAGPVVPLVLVWGHKLLPFLSMFDLMLGLYGLSYLLGGYGIYLFTKAVLLVLPKAKSALSGRFLPLWAGLCYLFLPLVLYLFPFSDGAGLASRSLMPFVLLFYIRFWQDSKTKDLVVLFGLMIMVWLVDTTAFTPMLLVAGVVLAAVFGWNKAENRAKQMILIFLGTVGLASYWYTPSYWWNIWLAPAFAGKPLYQTVFNLIKLLPILLAIGLSVIMAKKRLEKNRLGRLAVYWLLVFGSLTIIRFLSDPDFWQDWMAYAVELQMGVGMLMAVWMANKSRLVKTAVIGLGVLVTGLVFYQRVYRTLIVYPGDIPAYSWGGKLAEILPPGKNIFLSGTGVFWFNAFYDLPQLRGGNDRASVDPAWRRIAWEIREGTEPDKTAKAIKEGNIGCLVIHSAGSSEYYRDFKYPAKFSRVEGLELRWSGQGDQIYCLKSE